MKEKTRSIGILLVVLLMSWLVRFFFGNSTVIDFVRKIASVTWNS